MNEDRPCQVDIDQLMGRIRDEVGRKRSQAAMSPPSSAQRLVVKPDVSELVAQTALTSADISAPFPVRLNLPAGSQEPAPSSLGIVAGRKYHLKDLVIYEDAAFVHAAYQAALGRQADDEGLRCYLTMLREGASKAEILGRLCASPEGKQRRAKIEGVALPYTFDAISRWPVVGRLLGIALAIYNLPSHERRHRRLSNELTSQIAHARHDSYRATRCIYDALRTIERSHNSLADLTRSFASRTRLDTLQQALARTAASLHSVQSTLGEKVDRERLEGSIREIRAQLDAKADLNTIAGLSRQIQSVSQGKADRADMQQRAIELAAEIRMVADAKADANEVAAARDGINRIVSAHEAKAERVELERTASELSAAINSLADGKADTSEVARMQATLDSLSHSLESLRESRTASGSINEVRQALIRGLETKIERHELTVLTNHLLALVSDRPTTMDVQAISRRVDLAHAAIQELANAKADTQELDSVRASIKTTPNQEAIEALRSEVETIRAATQAVGSTFANSLKSLTHALDRLEQSKIGHSQIETVIADAVRSMNEIKERLIGRINEMLLCKADQESLTALKDQAREEFAALRSAITSETERALAAATEKMTESARSLAETKADVSALAAVKADGTNALAQATAACSKALADALAPISGQTQNLKRNVLDQERRLGLLLEEARKRFPKPLQKRQLEIMLTEDEHRLDAMYASFEDIFRGTRTDIRQRQSIYLPYIHEAGAGAHNAPVIDLGCGRGEWLELLKQEGFSAIGVDLNRIFLSQCRELQLDVREQDAVSFLRQLRPSSVGAVTSYHMIEHLPHKTFIALVDESLRVLRPGGVAIFETPNPRNLQVAACNFYLDPTHVRPIPPELSRYVLEARGFSKVEVRELHPFAAEQQVNEAAAAMSETLNRVLFSAQDYAIIARKA